MRWAGDDFVNTRGEGGHRIMRQIVEQERDKVAAGFTLANHPCNRHDQHQEGKQRKKDKGKKGRPEEPARIEPAAEPPGETTKSC